MSVAATTRAQPRLPLPRGAMNAGASAYQRHFDRWWPQVFASTSANDR
jgi:hypothetical protein